tara:strand:- start:10455 stop:11030 length:576 start_codon:yes stop_codon:yes gene_type:complete
MGKFDWGQWFDKKGNAHIYKRKQCHTGNVLAFQDPKSGVKVYGGGRTREVDPKPDMFLVSLDDNLSPQFYTNILPMQKINNPFVDIPWRDYGVPNVGITFWHKLVSTMRSLQQPVLIACVGGHGRTGTALSILCAMMSVDRQNPVKYIRDNYCDEAVESQSQINYIKYITGLNFHVPKVEDVFTYSNYKYL